MHKQIARGRKAVGLQVCAADWQGGATALAIEKRRRVYLEKGDRLLLHRLAYYEVLQTDAQFTNELTSMCDEAASLSKRARRQRIVDFGRRWNLPEETSVSDIEAAFGSRIVSAQFPKLGRVDLLRAYAVSRQLHGIQHVQTVDLERTIRFVYNPILSEHAAAVHELEEMIASVRTEVLQSMAEVELDAKARDVSPMPSRWGKSELRRFARRLYEHRFHDKTWKEITHSEIQRRGLGPEDLRESSVRKKTGEFARRLGISAKRGRRPAT